MKRWPIIRHIRWLITARAVKRNYRQLVAMRYLPINPDNDQSVLDAIWRGYD